MGRPLSYVASGPYPGAFLSRCSIPLCTPAGPPPQGNGTRRVIMIYGGPEEVPDDGAAKNPLKDARQG